MYITYIGKYVQNIHFVYIIRNKQNECAVTVLAQETVELNSKVFFFFF